MTSLIPKNTVFGVNTKPDRVAFSSSQSRKCKVEKLKIISATAVLVWTGPLSASASSLLRTLRCCIVAFLPLFAKTSEAGRCVSLFFNWKWRMAGEKHTHKKKKHHSAMIYQRHSHLQVRPAESLQQQNCSSSPHEQLCREFWERPCRIFLSVTEKIKGRTLPKLANQQLDDCICRSVLSFLSGRTGVERWIPLSAALPSFPLWTRPALPLATFLLGSFNWRKA